MIWLGCLCGSVGRATDLKAGGCGFESLTDIWEQDLVDQKAPLVVVRAPVVDQEAFLVVVHESGLGLHSVFATLAHSSTTHLRMSCSSGGTSVIRVHTLAHSSTTHLCLALQVVHQLFEYTLWLIVAPLIYVLLFRWYISYSSTHSGS